MITLTTLRAELQNRINAVTGATSLTDLLMLRKAAESMGITHTALDSEIQSRANAVTGSTSAIDLLRLSKLSIRGDKRIGEIVTSPFKADTLDDGALIRMAGVKVLKSAYPALAEVYKDQLSFGSKISLNSALTAAGVTTSPTMFDAVYANGVLIIPSYDKIIRTDDGQNFTRVGPALQFTCVCRDDVNNRWWAGTTSGLIYYSIDNCQTFAQNSAYSNGGIAISSISVSQLGTILVTHMNTSTGAGGAKYSTNVGGAWSVSTGPWSANAVAHAIYSSKHDLFIAVGLHGGNISVSSDGAQFLIRATISSSNFPGSTKYYRRLQIFGDNVVLQTNYESYILNVEANGTGVGVSNVMGVAGQVTSIGQSSFGVLLTQLFDGSVAALSRDFSSATKSRLFIYSDLERMIARGLPESAIGALAANNMGDSQQYGGVNYSSICDTPWGLFVGVGIVRSSCCLIPTKNYSSTEMYLPEIAPTIDRAGAPQYSYVVAK
jgi:hypothetical protein